MSSSAFEHSYQPRRSPRRSFIVVVPENHVVSRERLAQQLPQRGDREVSVIVACAGQPVDLGTLQETVGDAEFLLAPGGTTAEDLRALAMRRTAGDIVTLLDGAIALPVAVEPSRMLV